MSHPDIEELARRQLADYDAHRPGRMFEGGADFLTVEQAYALQLEVARLRRLRGEAVAGYKIGCVSDAIRRQFGLDTAVFGHVLSSEIYTSGVCLEASRFDHLAIEGEFALRIAEDVTSLDSLHRNPLRAIAAAFPVIELHNYVFRAAKPSGPELIANNALNAGAVLPPAETKPAGVEHLLDKQISVWRNGEQLGAATAREIPGGLLGSLFALAEQLARFDIRLQQGQIVLAGSPLPLWPVSPGDRIKVLSPRWGEVTMTVA